MRVLSIATLSLLFMILMVAGQSPAQAAVAGHIQFVTGGAEIMDADGQMRTAVKGAEVHAGETIVTGERGSVQVRMIDNGFLSIRPGSELKIDEYRYEGEQSDTSLFSLLKGNFRALTGMVAKHNRKAWQTQTATAVLGVRGSDADIGFSPGTQLTAIRTYTGGYTLTPRDSSMPSLDVDAGGIGVFSPGTPPAMAASFPFQPPAPRPQVGGAASPRDQDAGDPGASPEGDRAPPPPPTHVPGVAPASTPAVSGGAEGVALQTSFDLPPLPPQFPIASGTTVLSTTSTTAGVATAAPVGSGGVGAYIVNHAGSPLPSSGSMVVDGTTQRTATIGPANELRSVTDVTNNGSFKFDANTATLVKSAVHSIPSQTGTRVYTTSWGVWSGGYKIVDFGAPQTPVGGFYYAWADKITTTAELTSLAGSSFSYAMVTGGAGNETGAMATAFNVGMTGTFSGGATLGTVSISGNANFASGSTGWSFSGSGTVADLIDTDVGVVLGASCSSCSTASGHADGQFVGSKAEGLLLGVHGMDNVSGKSFVGSAILEQQPL